MSGFLLDTNAILIALADPGKLTRNLRSAISSGPNVLSVVSYWEVVIKTMKGMLSVGEPSRWWRDSLDQLAAIYLPLHPAHVEEVYALKPVHKDPFDRILIAQATAEHLTLLTLDRNIPAYSSSRLRILV